MNQYISYNKNLRRARVQDLQTLVTVPGIRVKRQPEILRNFMQYDSKTKIRFYKVDKKCKADQDRLDYYQTEYLKVKEYLQTLEQRNVYYNL